MVRLGKTELPSEEFSTTDNFVRAMFNPKKF